MMYASKTPRDLNRDPKRVRCPCGEREIPDDAYVGHEPIIDDPRPEYDAVQHNEPNLLLGVARRAHEDGHLSDFIEGFLGDGALTGHPMIDHARKVLSRLAALAENG